MTTENDVLKLVQSELERITDNLVRGAIEALLIDSPVIHERFWSPEVRTSSFICWRVAEDPASGTAYIYCEDNSPLSGQQWGIVSVSGIEMGMDSNWFISLERAFYDSVAAHDLPVWNVVKRAETDPDRIVAGSLTGDAAYDLSNQLNAKTGSSFASGWIYHVEPRTQHWW